jgi:hypothetical protein
MKKLDFFDAFAQLPEGHKATVVAALWMYAQVKKAHFGSVTFSRNDITSLAIFDEARPLDASKALDFASKLETL